MAFCEFCGKQLEEGEKCTCGQSQISATQQTEPVVEQPVQQTAEPVQQVAEPAQPVMENVTQEKTQFNQEQFQEKFSQAKQVSGAYLQQLAGAFLSVLKQPVTMGKEFVKTADMKLGIGFMSIQAILSAIFALICFGKINGVQKKAVSMWSSEVDSSQLFSLPKAFLLTIIGSLIMSLVVAGLLLVAYKVCNSEKTFQQVVCVAGVRSVGTSLAIIVSIIVSLISYGWGICIFVLSGILGLIFMARVADLDENIESDKMTYMLIAVTIVSLIVFFILFKNGSSLYMPKDGSSSIASYFMGSMY